MNELKGKLPTGWNWVKLGDIAKKQTLKVLPTDHPDAKFVGMDCIKPHTMRPSFTYKFGEFKSSGNYFKMGHVLYGRMRPYLNKVYRAEYDGTCSGEFIVLQCTDEFSPDLLKYILHARNFVNFTTRKTSGDRPRISYDEISEYPIALPPLPEQHAIVAKIEELLSDLDNGVQQLRTAQEQLKIYRQSLLKAAFEGRLTNKGVKDGELPEGWKWVKIDTFLSNEKKGMSTGPFGTMLKKSEHQLEGVPVLGIENIGKGVFQMPNKIFVTNKKAHELKNFRVKKNDIIISRSGTVGEICLLPKKMENSIISTNLIKVSLNQKAIYPKFFVYLFQGGKVRQQVFELCKGSSRAFLNQTILKSLDFPICSLEEQQLVVDELESKLTVCDNIEETITNSLKQAQTLRQSILKKAFEGRLV